MEEEGGGVGVGVGVKEGRRSVTAMPPMLYQTTLRLSLFRLDMHLIQRPCNKTGLFTASFWVRPNSGLWIKIPSVHVSCCTKTKTQVDNYSYLDHSTDVVVNFI